VGGHGRHRRQRLTDQDITDILELCKNDAQIAARPTGLTPRSRMNAAAK
jgi:hypothetical protein